MTEAQDLRWMVDNFADTVPGVRHAAVVGAEGLLLAMSPRLTRTQADQLGAIASGLASLTRGAARCFDHGAVNQVMVEMSQGFLFAVSVSEGSVLTVLTDPTADIGLIGYEMANLVAAAGAILTPELRRELQSVLPL